MLSDNPTLKFYADNAQTYAARTRLLPDKRLNEFLALLPNGGCILELGSGGGQDAAFMLGRGFDVSPTDGSPHLAAEAEKLLNRPVVVMRFDQLDLVAQFDAVWASACLLHVPRAELSDILGRVHRALKPNGHFWASYKSGTEEGVDGFGRFYNYLDENALHRHYRDAGIWARVDIEASDGSGYDEQPTRWLWVKAQV